jgi:hypothetical protein
MQLVKPRQPIYRRAKDHIAGPCLIVHPKDPRHAVGFMACVLHAAKQNITQTQLRVVDSNGATPATKSLDELCAIADAFVKSPRKVVINGAKRPGVHGQYERLKQIKLEGRDYPYTQDRHKALGLLVDIGDLLRDAMLRIMEDAKQYTAPLDDPATQYYFWHRVAGLACESELISPHEVRKFECEWQWMDLIERRHRGAVIKAAYEAAWLAGQYEIAWDLALRKM